MVRKKPTKLLVFFVLLVLNSVILTSTAFANSAEPPSLTFIVSFPPDDLLLSIRFADGSTTDAVPFRENKAWESYYHFYHWMDAPIGQMLDGATLIVQSSELSFECLLPETTFRQYNNLLTLNIKNQSIAIGQSLARLLLLFSMRMIFTLLIEGAIFFAFGYRKKTSWITFIVINFITQGALNALLNGPNLGSYWIIGFVFYEIIIVIIEAIAFSSILKEQPRRAVVYALTANIASLVLGGMMISALPI